MRKKKWFAQEKKTRLEAEIEERRLLQTITDEVKGLINEELQRRSFAIKRNRYIEKHGAEAWRAKNGRTTRDGRDEQRQHQ